MENTTDSSKRVFGGVLAPPMEYPWHAALYHRDEGGIYICGGSHLNDRYMLTAAHCWDVSS